MFDCDYFVIELLLDQKVNSDCRKSKLNLTLSSVFHLPDSHLHNFLFLFRSTTEEQVLVTRMTKSALYRKQTICCIDLAWILANYLHTKQLPPFRHSLLSQLLFKRKALYFIIILQVGKTLYMGAWYW